MDTKTEVVRSSEKSGEREADWVHDTPKSDNLSLPAADAPVLGESPWAGCGCTKAVLVDLSIIRFSQTH